MTSDILRGHYKGPGADFEGADLKEKDFTSDAFEGANFKGAHNFKDFTGTLLNGADFEETNLEGIRFYNTDLEGANFKGANLSKVNFYDSDLEGADFDGADFDRAHIEDVRGLEDAIGITNARFRNTHVDSDNYQIIKRKFEVEGKTLAAIKVIKNEYSTIEDDIIYILEPTDDLRWYVEDFTYQGTFIG